MDATTTSSVEDMKESIEFETALHLCGYGRFTYKVFAVSVLSMFTIGVQSCVASLVLPAAKCDLNMCTYQMGLAIMAYMIGGACSAFLWGIVADVFGRRNTLLITHTLDSIITLAESASTDFTTFALARALNGFLIGGPSNIIFIYLSELVGWKRRNFYLNLTGICFTTAWFILPYVGWYIIPFKSSDVTPYLTSWRLLLIIISIPGFTTAILIYLLPETPRFMIFTRNKREALKILMFIYEANSGKPKQNYISMVKQVHLKGEAQTYAIKLVKTCDLVKDTLSQLRLLMSKSYIWKSITICFVVFANMAAGFGLGLMIPELLTRIQLRASVPHGLQLCNYDSLIPHLNGSSSLLAWHGTCDEDLINDEPRTSMIITSLVVPWYCILRARLHHYLHRTSLTRCMMYNITSYLTLNSYGWQAVLTLFIMRNFVSLRDVLVFIEAITVGVWCVAVGICWSACTSVRMGAALCAIASSVGCGMMMTGVCTATVTPFAMWGAVVLQAATINGNVLIGRLLLQVLPPRLISLGVCLSMFAGRLGAVICSVLVGALLDLHCYFPFIVIALLCVSSVAGIIFVKAEDANNGPIDFENAKSNTHQALVRLDIGDLTGNHI